MRRGTILHTYIHTDRQGIVLSRYACNFILISRLKAKCVYGF